MTLTDRQRELLKGKTFQMVMMTFDTEDGGGVQYFCEPLKLAMNIFTPKEKGEYGKAIIRYAITGDKREFSTLEDAVVALDEKGMLGLTVTT